MSNVVVWALFSGAITGGVFMSIVLLQRIRTISERQPAELEKMRRRLDELESVERRVAELEERLDFTERLLSQQMDHERLPPAVD